MGLQGNPKKFAEDISNGFFYVTKPYLKNLSPELFKQIFHALKITQRDVRALVATELEGTKDKQIRLIRIGNTLVVMENYARKNRMIL
jgi:hypothetical protein